MVDNGMLRFGKFTLKSGRISPYLIHSGFYHMGSQISKLGEFYAECIRENAIETKCLVGLNSEDTPLLISTCMTLFNKYGVDVEYQITNKHFSENMTLITDTFTSGESLLTALEMIKNNTGIVPSDIIVCVDRKEKTENSSCSAKHMIESKYGVRIHPIVDLDDISKSIESGVISAGEYLENFNEYNSKYRGE